jgi:hypothetical protein
MSEKHPEKTAAGWGGQYGLPHCGRGWINKNKIQRHLQIIMFRTLDLWKIVMAPYYFRYQGRGDYKEALRTLRFSLRPWRVKHFSQRAQRLSG